VRAAGDVYDAFDAFDAAAVAGYQFPKPAYSNLN
jgi:hypothetical protein